MMRNAGLPGAPGLLLLALGLAGCGGTEAEAPGAATQRGIDRSVADIRAAEAATQQPVVVSKSVGELTARAGPAQELREGKPAGKLAGSEPPAAG